MEEASTAQHQTNFLVSMFKLGGADPARGQAERNQRSAILPRRPLTPCGARFMAIFLRPLHGEDSTVAPRLTKRNRKSSPAIEGQIGVDRAYGG
jgi:hypothetical protein